MIVYTECITPEISWASGERFGDIATCLLHVRPLELLVFMVLVNRGKVILSPDSVNTVDNECLPILAPLSFHPLFNHVYITC